MAQQDDREHLRKIVNHGRTGMLVTAGKNGAMHGRPMANVEVKEDFKEMWFATSRKSGKVEELSADDRVLVSYNNTSGSEWATVNGRGKIVDDRAKIKELWSPFWKNWFEGPEDQDLVLLQVTPESGEYWDSGNKVVGMVKFAVGAMIGKSLLEDENQKVVFKT